MGIEEAVEQYGIGRKTFEKLATSGIVPAERRETGWVFTNDLKLDAYIAGDPAMQKLFKSARRKRQIAKIAASWREPIETRYRFRRDLISIS